MYSLVPQASGKSISKNLLKSEDVIISNMLKSLCKSKILQKYGDNWGKWI